MPSATTTQPTGPDFRTLRGYLPIAVGTLAPAAMLDFDLFVLADRSEPVLFRGKNYPLTADDIERTRESGRGTLYIRLAEHERYCEHLRQVVLENPQLPAAERIQVLKAVNRSVFETAFQSVNTQRYVQFADQFAAELTRTVCEGDVGLTDIMKLAVHDYYTFTHVANVTTFCLLLARAMGYHDPQTLREIGTGALLHDYGKRAVSRSLLNYVGRLAESDRRALQQHPASGFRQLCLRPDVTWGQLMMVYQHHERPDGKGYPVGVRGDEIHPWARLCKVADVLDALTADRPYRRGDCPRSVVAMMERQADKEFDRETVECLRTMINGKPS